MGQLDQMFSTQLKANKSVSPKLLHPGRQHIRSTQNLYERTDFVGHPVDTQPDESQAYFILPCCSGMQSYQSVSIGGITYHPNRAIGDTRP